MANAENAAVKVEISQSQVSWETMTDSGDATVFNFSEDIVSKVSGYEPDVKPNGIASGINLVTPTASTNDSVDVAAFTAYFAGTLVSVSADTVTLTRDATNDYQKFSVICDSSGTLTMIESDAHATAFSTTRGAAGGPPSIPLAQIEVAQIWLSSNTAGQILQSEIDQSAEANTQERADYPLWDEYTIGDGLDAESSAKETAYVEFVSALPTIHGATANAAATAEKPVYVQFYAPSLSRLRKTVDFVEPSESATVNSRQVHRETVASRSTSLSAGSFNILLDDGITDNIYTALNKNAVVQYFQDVDKAPYLLGQGYLSMVNSRPVDADVEGTVTIAAERKFSRFES